MVGPSPHGETAAWGHSPAQPQVSCVALGSRWPSVPLLPMGMKGALPRGRTQLTCQQVTSSQSGSPCGCIQAHTLADLRVGLPHWPSSSSNQITPTVGKSLFPLS